MSDIVDFTNPRLVAIYDTVNAYEPQSQLDFYASFVGPDHPATIVELGCGTGIISRRLAADGHGIIAIDPSPAMIAAAKQHPDGKRVHWVVGDASDSDMDIDFAFMSGHIPQFMLTGREWHWTLSKLRSCLNTEGVLAFESRNPFAREWESWTRDNRTTVHDPVAGLIEKWSEVSDLTNNVLSYTNHYLFQNNGEEIVAPNMLRFRSQDELVDAVTQEGFVVESIYGDWDRRPATADAREIIIVARVNPEFYD